MVAGKKKFSDFESALIRLEEITDQLESGEVKLKQSLKLYTEGVEIAAFCSQELTDAEKKMKILKEQNEKLIEMPFDDNKDNPNDD